MISQALSKGFRQTATGKRFIIFLLLVNFLVGLLFLQPYTKSFQHFFSHRAATEALATQNLLSYLMDYYQYQQPAMEGVRISARVGVLINLLLSIFFAGGMVAFFLRKNMGYGFNDFWVNSARFFGRMLRIFLIQCVFLISGILFFVVLNAVSGIFVSKFTPVHVRVYVWLFEGILTVLFLNLLFMLLDYCKIFLVFGNGRSALGSLGSAFYFFRQFPGKTYLLHLILWLITMVLFAIQVIVLNKLPRHSTFLIYLSVFALQFFLFLRWGLKWWFIGSQASFQQMAMAATEHTSTGTSGQ